MKARAIAANVIQQVLKGSSLNDALDCTLSPSDDQPFIQAICYGVCRWYFRLEATLRSLLDQPLKEKDQDVHALLLVGLHQLMNMRVPPHAAVSETVAVATHLKKPWAKGLVNAVLRNYQRRADSIAAELQKDFSAHYSHPTWMIQQCQKSWGEDWEKILDANNQHPPFILRVNQRLQTRADYLKKLNEAEISAEIVKETSAGIFLQNPLTVLKIPGFTEGEVSVQDGAAQLAVELLELKSHQRILDTCAAPGGKTAHILETVSDAEVIAVDRESPRVKLISDNLKRLKLNATCICADVGNIKEWWDGKFFDRILLDAPCSASGVIRRHPDIKLLRREEDIFKLAKEQKRILQAVWKTLKPEGLLLYVTCSIFPEENSAVLQSFLSEQSDAKEEKITRSFGRECDIGRQILPGMNQMMDGFYFAALRKCSET